VKYQATYKELHVFNQQLQKWDDENGSYLGRQQIKSAGHALFMQC